MLRLSPVIVVVLALISASPVSAAPPSATPEWTGPDEVTVDLIRPGAGANRIYVYATLQDDEPALFQIDTGASLSVVSEDVAERLGLSVEDSGGFVEGLSGRAPLRQAHLTELRIGEVRLPDVEVAVGVPGVPEHAGAMRLDGILGNNIWSQFVLEVDYPADLLVLHRPGTVHMPRSATPMFFDGSHILAPIEVTAKGEDAPSASLYVQVDTGAGELVLVRDSGRPFARVASVGIEPVYGIGASQTLPPTQFLRTTRRVPLSTVRLGGKTIDTPFDAMWIDADGLENIKGLAGHELLSGHRALFDYQDGLFALTRSHHRRRQVDGHAIALDNDVARNGVNAPERGLYRGELLSALLRLDEADATLRDFIDWADPDTHAEDLAQARVDLAGVLRFRGDLAGAADALAPLSPAQLVDTHQIVAMVNGLLLNDRADTGREVAAAAVEARPAEGEAAVALADALVAVGDLDGAEVRLRDAAALAHNPDAYLLRRARIALMRGDRNGATAHVRRLVSLYPSEGLFLWFYALQAHDAGLDETYRHDLDAAMARLHPGQRPLDFLVAVLHTVGDDVEAAPLMAQGIARDCTQSTGPERDNCLAWYWSLAGVHSDDALAHITDALAQTGPRPDFLDTLAMVHLSRSELPEAATAAAEAARMAPDDIYMLWQAERLGALATSE